MLNNNLYIKKEDADKINKSSSKKGNVINIQDIIIHCFDELIKFKKNNKSCDEIVDRINTIVKTNINFAQEFILQIYIVVNKKNPIDNNLKDEFNSIINNLINSLMGVDKDLISFVMQLELITFIDSKNRDKYKEFILSQFEKYIKILPNNYELLRICSRFAQDIEESILALNLINKAIKIKPTLNSYITRSEIYMAKNNYKEAIKDLTIVINKHEINNYKSIPLDGGVESLLGECYMALQDYENAYKYYKLSNEYESQFQGSTSFMVEQEFAADSRIEELLAKNDAKKRKLKELKNIKEKEQQAKTFIEDKAKSQNEILSMFIHNYSTEIGQLKNRIDLISKFLINNNLLENPISDNNPKYIGNIIKEINSNINIFSKYLKRTNEFTSFNKNLLKFKKIKFITFITYFTDKVNKEYPNYNIKISVLSGLKNDIYIELDEFWVKEILKNLIENSVKHGFEEKTDNQIKLDINKIKRLNKEFIKIDYFNNGKPFPIGFGLDEFVQFYKKGSSEKEGSGIGGAFIKKIIMFHNGELNIPQSKIGVHFEILLPIKQEKENGEK
jgi:signal transduction histidine kinase